MQKQQRKYIAFLLIAVSMIMLAASVFPHHHHWHQICMQTAETHACDDISEHAVCQHDHSHSADGDCTADCITKFNLQRSQQNNPILHYALPVTSLFFSYLFEPLEIDNKADMPYYHEHLHSIYWNLLPILILLYELIP